MTISQNRSLLDYAEAFVALAAQVPESALPRACNAFVLRLHRDGVLSRAENIIQEIERLLLEREGFLRATVMVASASDMEYLPHIERYLRDLVGQPVRAVARVDSRLIAGFRASVEDIVVEASARGSLARLRSRLRTS